MTTLIKNIQLLDGTGAKPKRCEIVLKNDKIVAVGDFPTYRADKVVDGVGSYAAPGFIDVNTDSDRYLTLFSNPEQQDFLKQGVTTILGGQCGFSLAPLLYGSLSAIEEWADILRVNVDWHSVQEFLEVLGKKRLGVNFGTFIGHTTVREGLIGNRERRHLSKNEMAILHMIVAHGLQEGAFGVSSGLGYAQGQHISYHEVVSLAQRVAQVDGVFSLHLRDERSGLLDSVNEAIGIAKDSGVKLHISHFRPLVGYADVYDEAFSLIEKHADKANVSFDAYPFDMSTVTLSSLLPRWAQEGGKEEMINNLQSEGIREKIIRELPQARGEEMVILQAPRNEYLIGKTIKEFSENRNISVSEALALLMELTNFRAVIVYRNVGFSRVKRALAHPTAFVASNSVSFPDATGMHNVVRPERFTHTFTRFLELVLQEDILSLPAAIAKITSFPAMRFGIVNRGVLRDGAYADVVLFRDAQISDVFVNGVHAVSDGAATGALAGSVMKRKA